ncbi:MAG: hypothetical protein ACPG5T_08295, partial [Endozoicomonas sp.]
MAGHNGEAHFDLHCYMETSVDQIHRGVWRVVVWWVPIQQLEYLNFLFSHEGATCRINASLSSVPESGSYLLYCRSDLLSEEDSKPVFLETGLDYLYGTGTSEVTATSESGKVECSLYSACCDRSFALEGGTLGYPLWVMMMNEGAGGGEDESWREERDKGLETYKKNSDILDEAIPLLEQWGLDTGLVDKRGFTNR